MKIEDVEQFLKEGKSIEEFVDKIDWKNFEKLVKEIFSANSFRTFPNFRFKTEGRFEIDIVATKNNLIFAVDCKEWDRGKNKSGRLRKVAEEQIRRSEELGNFLKWNPIAKHKFKVDSKIKIIPIVVTWYEELVSQYYECFVVPVWKLNSFLIGNDFY